MLFIWMASLACCSQGLSELYSDWRTVVLIQVIKQMNHREERKREERSQPMYDFTA
jgi:hypothetical protein